MRYSPAGRATFATRNAKGMDTFSLRNVAAFRALAVNMAATPRPRTHVWNMLFMLFSPVGLFEPGIFFPATRTRVICFRFGSVPRSAVAVCLLTNTNETGKGSLLSQGDHGIHARRATRGKIARQRRNEYEEDRTAEERQRIGHADTVKQRGHEACERECGN